MAHNHITQITMTHLFKHSLVIIAAILLIACGSNNSGAKAQEQIQKQFPMLSLSSQKSIVNDLSKAMNDLANASIPFGGDTETVWAASQVDSLHNVITGTDRPFLEQMTSIYEMTGLVSYGLNYRQSIFGLYVCPDEAGYAYHSMNVCDSLVNNVAKTGFKDIMAIADLSGHAYYYTQLYMFIHCKLNDVEEYNAADVGRPLYNLEMLRFLKDMDFYSDNELIKMYFLLDVVSFFKTYCDLTTLFCPNEEQWKANGEEIIEIATYFDKMAAPVMKIIGSETPQKLEMTDEEFEVFMLKSTEYKVSMLQMITKGMKVIAEKMNL